MTLSCKVPPSLIFRGENAAIQSKLLVLTWVGRNLLFYLLYASINIIYLVRHFEELDCQGPINNRKHKKIYASAEEKEV